MFWGKVWLVKVWQVRFGGSRYDLAWCGLMRSGLAGEVR